MDTVSCVAAGNPKGVLVPHRGLANLCRHQREAAGLGPLAIHTQSSGPGFDALQLELWPILTSGGTVRVMPSQVGLIYSSRFCLTGVFTGFLCLPFYLIACSIMPLILKHAIRGLKLF